MLRCRARSQDRIQYVFFGARRRILRAYCVETLSSQRLSVGQVGMGSRDGSSNERLEVSSDENCVLSSID